jgi:hypothetical protein
VLGAQKNTEFFDAILKVVNDKLVAEPPTGPPQPAGAAAPGAARGAERGGK